MAAGAEAAGLLERPLAARSLVLSLLLGRHPGSAPVALLIRWCGLFDVSATSARVALSRMVDRGELTAADGTYALAGRLLGRQADQDQALSPALEPWDGRWLLAIADDGRRSATDRVALREALRRSRMVPWRESVWLRPDNLGGPAATATAADREIIERQCTWWRSTPEQPIDVAAAFDLDALATRGTHLTALLTTATAALVAPSPTSARPGADALAPAFVAPSPTSARPGADALAPAFVVGAATAQHLRRDPLLPAELLPRGWPAPELRRRYARYTAAMDRAIAAWLTT